MRKSISFTALFLSVLLVVNITIPAFSQELSMGKILIEEDMDGKDKSYSATGNHYLEVIDAEHGNSLCLKPSPNTNVFFMLDKPVKEDIIYITFDYMQTQTNNLVYLRVLNSKYNNMDEANRPNMAETFISSANGKLSYVKNSRGYAICESKINLEKKRWYKIGMCIDLKCGRVSYCYDNHQMGETALPQNFSINNVNGLVFLTENNNGGKIYLDNVKVSSVTKEELKKLQSEGCVVPQPAVSTMAMELVLKSVGHIYYDKNLLEFGTKVINKSEQDIDVSLKYEIYEGNHIINEDEQQESVLANESKEITVNAKSSRYGFFQVVVKAFDSEGNCLGEAMPQSFSVANIPPEEIKNPKLGVTVHTFVESWDYGTPKVNATLMEKAGFGFFRSDARWAEYEKGPKTYKLQPNIQGVLDTKKTTNFKFRPVFDFANPLYGDELPPVSQKAMEGYANYCAEFVSHPEYGIEAVEIWNEYNLTGGWFNRTSEPASRYAEMLKLSYEKIKKANPNVMVYAMDTAGVPLAWIEEVLMTGAGDYLDGISVHPYSNKQSPEAGGVVGKIAGLRQLMEKYGIQDKPIYLSEYGWASVGTGGYPNEAEQASYLIRINVLNEAYKLSDSIAWYGANNGGIVNTQEQRFGLVRGVGDDIPYEAKPSYLAAANYNAMMIDSTFIDMKKLSKSTTAYYFKLKNGKDCAVLWSIDNTENVGVKLGASSLQIYDMYGNPKPLHSTDGVFSVQSTRLPVYLVGDFSEFDRADSVYGLNVSQCNVVKGDRTEFKIISNAPDVTAELEMDKNLSISERSGFYETEKTVVLQAELCDKTKDNVGVTLKKGKNPVFYASVDITYSYPIEVGMVIAPYNAKQLRHRQLIFNIKSNAYSNETAGHITFTEPQDLVDRINTVKIPTIKPGKEATVKVNIPSKLNQDMVTIGATISMDNGEEQVLKKTVSSDCCVYAENKPVIDGVLEKDEWCSETRFKAEKFVELNGFHHEGENDLSAVGYTVWDEDNFYYALEVTDDSWNSDDVTNNLWASDGVQFAMTQSRASNQIAQLDFGRLQGKPTLYMEDSPNGANLGEINEGYDLAINREGSVTTYELRIPWSIIFFDGFEVKKNTPITFSTIINDNDGKGREGYIEYGGGIGDASKNVAKYRDLYLLGRTFR